MPEIMDQPGLTPEMHASALRGLGRINSFSRSAAILWPSIAALARGRGPGDPPLRVLDLASGGGDVAIALARRAKGEGLELDVEGCDISSQAVEFARDRARHRGIDVRFFESDALADTPPRDDYDVIACSLFLHHLDEAAAIELLRRMAEAAGQLVLVNDLVRGRFGYWLAKFGCRLLSRSPVVHYDGPASVAGAFTVEEARGLAERAGLSGTTITRHWPQRFLLSWRRGG